MELTIKIKDKKIYEAVVQFLKSLHIEVISQKSDTDDAEWQNAARQNLARAYSNDEPDYTENMVKEPNVTYERR